MSKISWLKREAILEVYSQIVENSSNKSTYKVDTKKLDEALLEIKKSYQSASSEQDVIDVAISYLTQIMHDRPFESKNKKMAFACCESFLTLNGYAEINAVDNDLMEILVDVAEDNLENNEIAKLIREELA